MLTEQERLFDASPDLLRACMLGRDAAAALMRAIHDLGYTHSVFDHISANHGQAYNGFGKIMDAAIAKARREQ